MNLTAKGLRVLVTASGSGIGRAIATTLRDNGARVHACGQAISVCANVEMMAP